MARQIKVSGEDTGVYQRKSGVVAGGLQDLAKGVGSLGGDIHSIGLKDKAWELEQIKFNRSQKMAKDALALKTQKALDASNVDLETHKAESRKKAFVKSQGLVHNDEILAKNLEEFERAEKGVLQELKDSGTISAIAHEELERFAFPKIYGSAQAETGYQIDVARSETTIGNYNTIITNANAKGDVETANLTVDKMVMTGALAFDKAEGKKIENFRLSERGLFQLDIMNANTQDELDILDGELKNGEYEHLNLNDQKQLRDIVNNQREYLWKSEQLPAVRAIRESFEAGKLTLEEVRASAMPELDKQLFEVRLNIKREQDYLKMKPELLGDLSEAVKDYMDGGYIGAGGSKRQSEAIMEIINNNKVPDYVVSDILNILFDGEASANGMKFLGLDRNDVKYPKKMVEPMDKAQKEFNKLTSDLTARQKVDAFGDFYFPTYQYHYGILNQGKRILGMEVPEVDPIEILRDARLNRDANRSADVMLGHKAKSLPLEEADTMVVGTDLGLGLTPDENEEVRQIMRVTKKDKNTAFTIYKGRQ